jgi:hypothetical protein
MNGGRRNKKKKRERWREGKKEGKKESGKQERKREKKKDDTSLIDKPKEMKKYILFNLEVI